MNVWTSDNLLVNAEAQIEQVCWFYGINSIEEVPSCEVVQKHQWHDARLLDVIEMENGRHAVIFDIFEEVDGSTIIRALTGSLRVIERKF